MKRYERQGILALQPTAFLDLFVEAEELPSNEIVGSTSIVTVRGPLEHHAGSWCDSYEDILERVDAACESTATTIVLKIDSPGGLLTGLFDTVRAIRTRTTSAGKRLVAYVEGCACSAGYALACAAERIYLSQTAFAGSIGILITRIDLTAADAAMGARFALVASGKRKADGSPHVALTEAELASMQAECDGLADLFFQLVSTLRPGLKVEAIRALEAGTYRGEQAVSNGLADQVCSFDEMLAALANGGIMADEETTETAAEGSEPFNAARGALERAVNECDGDELERVRAALAALTGESAGEGEAAAEPAPAAAAAAPAPAVAASAAPHRVSAAAAGDLAATINALAADVDRLKAERENLERSTLLASRPDLSKALVAKLQTMPVTDARAIVDGIPRPVAPKPAATATVTGTRGASQGSPLTLEQSPETAEFDRAFGLSGASAKAVRREGTALVFDSAAHARTAGRPAPTKGS